MNMYFTSHPVKVTRKNAAAVYIHGHHPGGKDTTTLFISSISIPGLISTLAAQLDLIRQEERNEREAAEAAEAEAENHG